MTQQQVLALHIPDDFMRAGAQTLIKEHRGDIYTVIVVRDFEGFIRDSRAASILIMDGSGLRIDLIEKRLRRLSDCCQVRTIIISDELKVVYVRRVMQAGAKGFIYREDLSISLMLSIDVVARDVVSLSPQALEMLTHADQLYIRDELKPQDMRVLKLTARGVMVKNIAETLKISERTVYRSRDTLMQVLGASNVVELVNIARDRGLLETDDNQDD